MSSGARAVVASVVAAFPAGAAAQSRVELLPALTLSQSYDDNLFSSPEPGLSDSFSGAAPRLQLRVLSRRFEGRLSYRQEAEWYRSQPSLDAMDARREGSLELRLDGRRGLRFSSAQSYRTTQTPAELLPTLGLDLGRFPARQISTSQTLRLPLSARTSTTLGYSFVADELQGGVSGRNHEMELGLERRLAPQASFRLGYFWRRFRSGLQDGVSHVLVLGLDGMLGRSTQLRLLAGPRITDGELDRSPELDFLLRRTFRRGELAATYARSQLRIIGQPGVAATESAGLRIGRDVATSRLRLSVSPGWFKSSHPVVETSAYRIDSELRWSAAAWLSVVAAHSFAAMRGGPQGEVVHNLVALRLELRAPERPLASRPGAQEEER